MWIFRRGKSKAHETSDAVVQQYHEMSDGLMQQYKELKSVHEHQQGISDMILQQFQDLKAAHQQGMDRLTDSLEKTSVASENIRIAIVRQTDWKPFPPEGVYRKEDEREFHNTIYLPFAPDYNLTLTVANPRFPDQSATWLMLPQMYATTQCVNLPDGHDGYKVQIKQDYAPLGFLDALRVLLAAEGAEVWLNVHKAPSDESKDQSNIVRKMIVYAYRFRTEYTLAPAQTEGISIWQEEGVLYFDRSISYSRVVPVLTERSLPPPISQDQ